MIDIFVLLFVVSVATQPLYPSEPLVSGSEVIYFDGPGSELTNTFNLIVDESNPSVIRTLYFLADKGPSNLYTAFYDERGGQHPFWASGVSPFQNYPIDPFISFDVMGNNFIGIALPSNYTLYGTRVPLIQSIYNGSQVYVTRTVTPPQFGYNFVSTFISQTQTENGNFVYFAGWNTTATSANTAFVVARGTVKLGTTDPQVIVQFDKDILPIQMSDPCYDLFGPGHIPHMNISGNFLILLVPGRCATIAKITLPTDFLLPFSEAAVEVFDPTNVVTQYVSSAIFDYKYQVIYYTIKTYHSPFTTLHYVNVSVSPLVSTTLSNDTGVQESEAILVLGTETENQKDYRYLFVLASGSNKIIRYLFDGKTLITTFYAVLDQTLNQISSSIYIQPWLFFVTYEPDAKIARIDKINFCDVFCKETGYCSSGTCKCNAGYVLDTVHPEEGCVLKDLQNAEVTEQRNEEATLALGILFGLTLAIAIAGWTCWWRSKQATYTAV